MYQSNLVRDELTNPLLPKSSHQKPHFLKNYFSVLSLSVNEAISIAKTSYPSVLTGLFLYFRSFACLFFLCGLGGPTLAGGSTTVTTFANINGYSLFYGLIIGVEFICSQAIGTRRHNFVQVTMKRDILLLLLATYLPIMLLGINTKKILRMLKQEAYLASEAQTFLLYSVPDLIAQSFLHLLRDYLTMESKTVPLVICTVIASFLHWPITLFFVGYLDMGTKGVALSGVVSKLNLVALLFIYITFLEEKPSIEEHEQNSVENI